MDTIATFRRAVRRAYKAHGRDLPWRHTADPWRILVSEIMLQQTQVPRVVEKYGPFLAAFPTPGALAAASVGEALAAWSGLGYNRRALMLRRAAGEIVARHGGEVPRDEAALRALPGIGPYTAAAVMAFAFDEPAVLIETNIRSVFIHHFFPGRDDVRDSEILPLVERTLDRRRPREWYSALMDWGAHLKATAPNPSRRSAHHTRQSAFEGSDRQIRGRIIRTLVEGGAQSVTALTGAAGDEGARTGAILAALIDEGLVVRDGPTCRLA